MYQKLNIKICLIVLSITLLWGCKEMYNPEIKISTSGYLIVEGQILYGNDTTSIQLSRSIGINSLNKIVYENNASVLVEGDDHSIQALSFKGNGVYKLKLNLNKNTKYRINISTKNGSNYISNFAPVLITPELEASWEQNNKGVEIFANTQDATGNTKYYMWKFDEDWEIRSNFMQSLKYTYNNFNEITGVDYIYPDGSFDTTIFRCWKNNVSKSILIADGTAVSNSHLKFPLSLIPMGAEKLSVLYHTQIKQYAISAQGYQFLLQMKKNTEQLGSIFDPQPTSLKSNIYCTNNQNEIVIGYVDVTSVSSKKFFIKNSEVKNWQFSLSCMMAESENNKDSIIKKLGGLTPTIPMKIENNRIATLEGASPECVDCTLRGGFKTRPSFWPN